MPHEHTTDSVFDIVVSTLKLALQSTGDFRYKAALGMVRQRTGRPAGRPAYDDTAALDAMRDMIEAGDATTIEEAARCVSRTLTGQQSAVSTCKRLADKYRRNQSGNILNQ